MPAHRILVTPRSVTHAGHPALIRLRDAGYELRMTTPGQRPGTSELLRLLPGCIGYLAGVEPIGADVLEAATDLRVISRNGTGTNNIDVHAARRLGICVLRADGANARGVAELMIGLVIALIRSIPAANRCLKANQWERTLGIELAAYTEESVARALDVSIDNLLDALKDRV